jgi:long-chain acyl-CoA synthetase
MPSDASKRPAHCDVRWPKGTDLAEILFTTGSTGRSKGVLCTHDMNVAIAENVVCAVGMKRDNREVIPCPFSHSNGIRRAYANLYNGSTVVVAEFINRFFETVVASRGTSLDLVPSYVSLILQLSGDRLTDFKDQIDYVQVTGATFGVTDKLKLARLLPNSRLYDFYGSTEAGCVCTHDFNANRDKIATLGNPTRHSRIRFVDERGEFKQAGADDPGYVAISGPNVMRGYFNDPKLTAQTMKDGYFLTRDLGYLDADGYLCLIGRQDDIINMGGIKISPDEIESIALAHPNIAECACVSAEDKVFGHVPKLFVVASNPDLLDMRELKEYLRMRIDSAKMPRRIELIAEIPKTANGKPARRELRGR